MVTGANGGIGAAIVKELLKQDVAKVYAAARSIGAVAELTKLNQERLVPVRVDVTHATSVATLAEGCKDVDVLINNAGMNQCCGLLSPESLTSARQEMEVNYFGTLAMCQALAPQLIRRRGTIVNVCSILSMVNLPANGTYSASKAATHSLVQGLRAELAPHGVRVTGVYPGPVDTRMTAGQEMPKATPQEVAEAIVTGIIQESEEIFPDGMSRQVHSALQVDAREVERQFAAMLP